MRAAIVFMNKYLSALLLIMVSLFCCPKTIAQEQFRRGLEQISFIPKGQWITGLSVSYSQSSQHNYQFLVLENLSGNTYTFKLSPMVFYSFKDNMAAGLRFAYSRSKVDLTSADLVLDSETGYEVGRLYSIGHNYSWIGGFRNYISLGNNHRFGVFNEVQVELGGGQSKIVNGSGTDLTGTYERNFKLNIGLAPGIIMFLNNYSALEVNVGVLGFTYTDTRSITDQIYVAKRNSQQANFKINLFSITFGVAFYL